MKKPRFLLVIMTAVVLLAGAAPAFGATPQLAPKKVFAESFETAYPSRLTVSRLDFLPSLSTGWWGRTSKLKHLGSWSLWCSAAPTAPSLWPSKYAVGSAGTATFNVSEIKNYYLAKLAFSYSEPTLGGSDGDSFVVRWYDAALQPWTGENRYGTYWYPMTSENGWRTPQVWLTNPYSSVNLSRKAGKIVFQWSDSADTTGTPTGEGPTIDDVSVSGWYYGPVRSLTAAVSGTSVKLSWLKPLTAVGSSTTDTRAMTFRVFRATLAAPDTWVERTTGAGVSGTTFTDTGVATGAYRYLVQAVDAAGNYGQARVPNETVNAKVGTPAKSVERIQGTTRILTAIAASKRAYPQGIPSSAAVVIADGWDWSSALAGAALAAQAKGPLLLVNYASGDLPQEVADELVRLGARKAYVIGSNAHVRESVVAQMQQLSITTTRIDGGSPTGTSRDVAKTIKSLRGGTTGGTVFLCRSDAFPDALAAASLSAKLRAPIGFTATTALSSGTDQMLRTLQPQTIIIVGPLSAGLESTVRSYSWAPRVGRKNGTSAVDTSRLLAEYGKTYVNASPRRVFLVSSSNYADGLGGAVLAAIDGGNWSPMMLVTPTGLDAGVASFIDKATTIHDGTIMGGSASISTTVDGQLRTHLH